jgi:hypothetical protein
MVPLPHQWDVQPSALTTRSPENTGITLIKLTLPAGIIANPPNQRQWRGGMPRLPPLPPLWPPWPSCTEACWRSLLAQCRNSQLCSCTHHNPTLPPSVSDMLAPF